MGSHSQDDAVPPSSSSPHAPLPSIATTDHDASSSSTSSSSSSSSSSSLSSSSSSPNIAQGTHLPTPSIGSQSHVTDMPPFWSTNRHSRASSSVSYQSLNANRPQAIVLEDHSEEDHVLAQSCWAKSVSIDDYSVVSGPTGIGAYVVWHCTVSTLKGGDVQINKRYSEFDSLRASLVKAFPHADAMIPTLPRKSHISRFRPKFLENRRNGLLHFINCILLNPEFASSPILKGFIFE